MKLYNQKIVKIGSAILILILGFAVMQLLAISKEKANKIEPVYPRRKVEIIVPHFTDIPYNIEAHGLIESAQSIDLYSTVTGKVTYTNNNLISGTAVEKGELLLKIDSRQAENSLNLARAELIKSVASIVPQFKTGNASLYNKWNSYLNSLSFTSAITAQLPSVSNSREKLLISTYGIYSSYYNVKNAEIYLEQHSFISPIDGHIHSEGLLENSFVSPGRILLSIIDAKHLKVSVPLTVDQMSKIDSSVIPRVEISGSDSGQTILWGRLLSRDMRIDQSSQMIDVYIEFDNPQLDPYFAPGNYVDISIEGQLLLNTAAIPRSAIIDNRFVYTYESEVLGRKDIQIKAISHDTVYVENTFSESVQIITTILQKPLMGMKLSLMGEDELADEEKEDQNEKDS